MPIQFFCLNVDNCRFFVRATGKNGQLLSNGEPGQFFVIELVDGRCVTKPLELKLSLDDKKLPVTPGTLYFSSNGELQSYVDAFRFLIPAALWANLVIAGLWAIWFLSEVRTKRRIFFAFTQVILPLMFLGGWYLLASF